MAFSTWIHAQLVTEEQFQMRLRKYGWLHYLFQFSLVNSSYRTVPTLFIYYLYLLFTSSVVVFHLFCYIKTALNAYSIGRADMSVANVHSIILGIFILSVLSSYVVDKTTIVDIEELYLESLFDYDTVIPNSATLFEVAMTFCGKLGIVLGGMGLFTNVYLAAPLMDLRFWKESCVIEGINFCLALPHYYPYDSEDGWKFHATEIFQVLFGVYRISVFCAVQVTLTLWPLHLVRELSKLKASLEGLEERIKKRYYQKTKINLDKVNLITMNKDKVFNECASFCINENIQHHHNILRYHGTIDAIMAIPSFLAYTTGTATMAIAMVKLLSVEGDTTLGGNIAYVTVLGAEIGFMILISVMGEAVTMKAEEIFDEVAHIRIENYDLDFRRKVIIFMEGTIQPIALSSSKFNKCNMEAFGNVLNAAYSFYNVTSASAALDK
uniref:Odorant receptor n=1 Tax=Adelphocoris lineolatus TaxID=236346 RepID=A0A2I4PH09_ADELI|nr:olfactory receptor 10 [Adelphocoris lineolatus]